MVSNDTGLKTDADSS